MKNFILILLFSASLFACKKDNDNGGSSNSSSSTYTYEGRLNDMWELVAVEFDGAFPDPQNPFQQIQFSGSGTDVNGLFDLSVNPNRVNYLFSFTANVDLGDTNSIPLPITQTGKGSWTTTSDDSKLFIDIDDSDDDQVFTVLLNEQNTQKFKTTIPYEVFPSFTIDVEAELTFDRN